MGNREKQDILSGIRHKWFAFLLLYVGIVYADFGIFMSGINKDS
jgi:hypothetical protein